MTVGVYECIFYSSIFRKNSIIYEILIFNQSVEKSIEKLTERNMLGRLAKSLRLNEQGKQKMFNYFEKGEIK